MKTKLGIVILVLACAGLAIALFATKKAADERLKTAAYAILDFSKQLVNANKTLDDYRAAQDSLTSLERRNLRRGLITLCVAGGMGIATIIERV